MSDHSLTDPRTGARVMTTSTIASRADWLVARRALLAKEKEATRQRDALNAERRALPAVEVEKEYVFEGPDGPLSLRELFWDHPQLIVYHFMFDPSWEAGCKSCAYVMDNLSGALMHLGARDTAFVAVTRAPLAKIDAFKARMGWDFRWISSAGISTMTST